MKKVIYGIITGGVVAGGATLAVLSTAGTARADEATVSAPAGISTTLSLGQSVVDETVYVFLNEDGSVKKTISSDWSKNDLGADTYTKTEGKVATPIEVAISYYLDGKKVSADEIRGRSGRVKIRYDYTNTERVNGMYMPYAVLSGAVLSNEKFSNVTVTNGRLMNDGSRTAVVGVTLPGMKENLGVDVDLPEYFEIEADAKEFKMEMTATLATSKVFAELDVSALDSIDSLSSQLDTLASSMTQLMDGSVQLRDGLATLNDSTGALVDGATKLRAGSLQLVDGANSLSDGLAELANGAETLGGGISDAYTGATQLDAGVDQLVASLDDLAGGFTTLNADNANTKLISGAKQLFDGTLNALKASLSTITADNYETVLSGAISQATEAAKQAAAAGATDQAAEYQAKATALSTSLAQLSLYDGVQKYVAGVNQIAAGAAEAPAKVAPLKNGASALASGLKTMSEKAPELSSGLSSAYGGSKELATGMASLDAGLSNLSSNVPALTEGVAKLYQGSGSLSDGLSKFNEEGVQKLISLYNGNVKTLVSKVQNVVSIAKNAGSKVKYIYRTPEI